MEMVEIKRVLQKMKIKTTTNRGTCDNPDERKWIEQTKVDSLNSLQGDLDKIDGYNCEICRNKGFVSRLVYQEIYGQYGQVTSACKCLEIRETIKKFKQSGLENILTKYTFEKFEVSENWQKVLKSKAIEFAQKAEKWFFIGGCTGAGKTHICTAIAGEFLKKQKAVKYMLWRDDIVKLKSSVNDSEEYARLISDLKNAEVLYIDDLFKTGKNDEGKPQKPTVADINIAFEILNYRCNNDNLITIISSECTLYNILDIDEAVGGRISEKAFQSGYGFNITPDRSKNYRLKNVIDL